MQHNKITTSAAAVNSSNTGEFVCSGRKKRREEEEGREQGDKSVTRRMKNKGRKDRTEKKVNMK